MLAHPSKTCTTKMIAQHFHWSSLATNVQWHVQLCATCQHYKKQRKKYGHLPIKTHHDLDPWEEVHVDLIGPWLVLQPPIKKPKPTSNPSAKPPFDCSPSKPIQVLALTMIDPTTNYMELLAIADKESRTVAHAFDRAWLCRYPRPMICLHDKGTKFTGIKFQELLQSYGITPRIASSANPQTDTILERTHQVIANQLCSLKLMAILLQTLTNIQQDLLAPSNGLSMQPSIQSFK
jgi:Integrase zinc binding domain